MSASDKKKLRKEAESTGLTQREMKDRAEAQAAKRKKTTYTAVGVVCAVAAAGLLIWNSMNSGFLAKNATAATVGGVDYKVPDLQYYYTQARNEVYSLYSQYGMTPPSDGGTWFDESKGQTYADYFRESALNSLKQVTALCDAAKAEGYTLSEEGQAQIDDTFKAIDQICVQNGLTRGGYFSQVYGISEKVFTRNLENATLAAEYSQNHQESIPYEDADLQAYYDEHPNDLDSYDYRVFTISGTAANPTDENGDPLKDEDGKVITATEEEKKAAMEAAKAKADAAVAEIEAAEDREEAFIAAAPNYVAETSKDAYADPAYSLNTAVQGSTLTRNAATISEWLMGTDRKAGDVTAIENTTGYQVVLFLDRYLVQDTTVDIRHILIKAETTDEDKTDEYGYKIPSQAAIDAAKAEAEALLEEWKSGEATEASFGKLAREHSADPGSASKGGEYTFVPKGQMFEGFDAWISDPARQPGDTGLVENPQPGQQGWHVIYFEQTQEPQWKGVAIQAKQSTEQAAWLEELTADVEAVAASGMKHVGAANTAKPTETAAPAESEAPETSETPAE